MLKDKRGGEKYMSIWWFFALILVGTMIIVAVLVFFSAEQDIRDLEVELLLNKVPNCLITEGQIIVDFYEPGFTLFEKCRLSPVAFRDQDYYLSVEFLGENGNLLPGVSYGDVGIKSDCDVAASAKGFSKNYPRCGDEEREFLYTENGISKKGKLVIFAASNAKGKELEIE